MEEKNYEEMMRIVDEELSDELIEKVVLEYNEMESKINPFKDIKLLEEEQHAITTLEYIEERRRDFSEKQINRFILSLKKHHILSEVDFKQYFSIDDNMFYITYHSPRKLTDETSLYIVSKQIHYLDNEGVINYSITSKDDV